MQYQTELLLIPNYTSINCKKKNQYLAYYIPKPVILQSVHIACVIYLWLLQQITINLVAKNFNKNLET